MVDLITKLAVMYACYQALTYKPLIIEPMPIVIELDGRVLSQGIVKYALQRAAHGPSGLVGG